MQTFLKTLQKRLTNLSQSNKALFHKRIVKAQDVDLHEFDFVQNEPSVENLKALIANKKVILCQELDSRNESNNQLSKQLKNIYRQHHVILEERGTHELYVAWPYVCGKLQDDTLLRAPLLYIPVNLELKGDNWEMKQIPDLSISINKSLLLAYQHYNQVEIKDEFIDTNISDFGKDYSFLINQLYDLLKNSPLEINFNREMFEGKLSSFSPIKKAEYGDSFGTGQLKLEPNAVLGLFPQANSYLVPDYDNLLKTGFYKGNENFFLNKNIEFHTDRSKEEYTFTPYPIDGSQERAIKRIKNGESLVIQGPPGSGKSQLICNLVSDFIARGRSVLVVSQKRVALNVVHDRLKEKKLHRFTSLVHDIKSDRKKVYEQIAEQIEMLDDYQQMNNNLDTIQNERDFLNASRNIDRLCEEFSEFKTALFDTKELGVSIKELYLNSDPNEKHLPFNQNFTQLDWTSIQGFKDKINQYSAYFRKLFWEENNWKRRNSFKNLSFEDEQKIKLTLEDVSDYVHHFESRSKEVLGFPLQFDQAWWVLEREEYLVEFLQLIKSKITHQYFKNFVNNDSIDEEWLTLKESQLLETFKNEGIERTLKDEELGQFQETLSRYLVDRRNPIKRMYWTIFRKDKYWLKRVLVANGLEWNRPDLEILTRKLDNRLNYEHAITALRKCTWLSDIPDIKESSALQKWFDIQFTAIQAKKIADKFRSFKRMLNLFSNSFEETQDKIEVMLDLCREAKQKRAEWNLYLSKTQVEDLIREPQKATIYKEELNDLFETMCEWDSMWDELSIIEQETFTALLDELGEAKTKHYLRLFENSIYLAWIAYIEKKHPVLQMVSTPKVEKLQVELEQHIKNKNELALEILHMKAREKTYYNLDFNRLKNRVTYRDLHHQCTKKKRIWPLRKTIAEFEEELFKLVPCWLVSPEAASALFPMMPLFDLVIFDEASQCFLEKGFPVMYRGKQLCICGDKKQLQPNDLYQVRWDEEQEEQPDLEIDSLLDFSSKYLPQESLLGHYRSKSLDLIEFSNKNFYRGKLQMIPSKQDYNDLTIPFQYHKLDAIWENGCNPTEAKFIAKEVLRYVHDGQKSIGIVCFNFKQQQTIQDELEMLFDKEGCVIPSSLFIKNIENVQGDERDIIIFSITYAPDITGKFRMNFGLLNLEGGENRLNVAITRAQSKIVVVASILPHQLSVEDSLHKGPKLLKEYLTFVHEKTITQEKTVISEEVRPMSFRYLNARMMEEETLKDIKWNIKLPFADMVEVKDGKFEKLVLTDDHFFYSEPSAKAVFAYRPMALQDKGWKTHQTYSRRFWKNGKEGSKDVLRYIHQ